MNIYITLDYELFLGTQTGSVDNCLIRPTFALLEVLERYGVKASFFVDAAYLMRVTQLMAEADALKHDYNNITKQIKQLDRLGHSIQFHFHPQWIYSQYENGAWKMDFEHYKLEDMCANEVENSIVESYGVLQSLVTKRITTFRAGGYSLMDFDRYKMLFGRLGIKNDTSVLRGKICSSRFQSYNYKKVPNKSSYPFSTSIVELDMNGDMMEYPITTAAFPSVIPTLKTYFAIKKSTPDSFHKWGDGKSISQKSKGGLRRLIVHARMLFGRTVIPASIDSGAIMLETVVTKSMKTIDGDNIVIIGHPKNLNNLSLENLDRFIKRQGTDAFKAF